MKIHTKQPLLRALRLNGKEMISIGILFSVTILSWCIAEGSTALFREKIESELQSVIASDISVLSQTYPENTVRESLRKIAQKYSGRISESIELSYTLEKDIEKNNETAS